MNASSPSLSIVIPVFNERRTIRKLIRVVQSTPYEKEIILVDDCSTDGTRQILKEHEKDPSIKLILLGTNRGKGHAVRVGIAAATKDVGQTWCTAPASCTASEEFSTLDTQ